MSTEQLTQQAMALPPAERVKLAQELWDSVDEGAADDVDEAALSEALRRSREIDEGVVRTIPHEEVMRAARRAIGCE